MHLRGDHKIVVLLAGRNERYWTPSPSTLPLKGLSIESRVVCNANTVWLWGQGMLGIWIGDVDGAFFECNIEVLHDSPTGYTCCARSSIGHFGS
eukprot:1410242-Ditylum_brightwellii.AAC.1